MAPATESAAAPAATVRIEIFSANQSASLDFYTRVLRFIRPASPFPHQPRLAAQLLPGDDPALEGYIHITRGPIVLGLSWGTDEHYHPLAKDFTRRYELRDRPLGVEIVLMVPTLEDLHAERQFILDQGWPLDSDLELRPWGLWDFRVKDPDGYYWRITIEAAEPDSSTSSSH